MIDKTQGKVLQIWRMNISEYLRLHRREAEGQRRTAWITQQALAQVTVNCRRPNEPFKGCMQHYPRSHHARNHLSRSSYIGWRLYVRLLLMCGSGCVSNLAPEATTVMTLSSAHALAAEAVPHQHRNLQLEACYHLGAQRATGQISKNRAA
jgi:hypothetical protein